MPGLLKRLEDRSRLFYVVVSLAIVAAVGVIDYATEWQYSWSVFYLMAVGIAAWFVGKRFAQLVCLLSVVVSLGGDFASATEYISHLEPYWNASIVLVFYLVVVSLLIRLRTLHQELENRVQQRTAALTSEMAERQRLESELLEISEREQRRISHDLHDSLGQHLTGAALAGQVLEEKLSARRVAEAADARRIVDLLEDGIALSRNLAKGLDPIEISADGLMQALDDLAASTSEMFKMCCRFECDSPVLVRDAATSRHLYRITQEALTNAIKHGKAKNVIIRLEPLEDGLELEVRDDGAGLPMPLPSGSGMGMRIMAHRASMIGATFEARRNHSSGTTIACVLRHQAGERTS